jgi:hypothetical protein
MSIWDSAVRRQLVKEARKRAKSAQLFINILGKLREGFYDRRLVDVLFQRWDRDVTIEDAYCFGRLWNELNSGLIHVQRFDIGREPLADTEKQYNNEALQGLRSFVDVRTQMPLRLVVEFFGGAGDQDGYVRLLSDLTFERESCEGGCCPAMRCVAPKKTWFPLEVGTTTAARTLGHLLQERGIVRWPYGSTEVTFLYVPHVFDVVTKCHPYESPLLLNLQRVSESTDPEPLAKASVQKHRSRKMNARS